MKSIAAYKDKKGYIFIPLSKTIDGFWVSTEPFTRVEQNVLSEIFKDVLMDTLSTSQSNVPNPIGQGPLKAFERVGLKSYNDLNKKDIKYCLIQLDDNLSLVITPSVHNLPPTKGYSHKPKEDAVEIDANSSSDEIFKAFEIAFARCE